MKSWQSLWQQNVARNAWVKLLRYFHTFPNGVHWNVYYICLPVVPKLLGDVDTPLRMITCEVFMQVFGCESSVNLVVCKGKVHETTWNNCWVSRCFVFEANEKAFVWGPILVLVTALSFVLLGIWRRRCEKLYLCPPVWGLRGTARSPGMAGKRKTSDASHWGRTGEENVEQAVSKPEGVSNEATAQATPRGFVLRQRSGGAQTQPLEISSCCYA